MADEAQDFQGDEETYVEPVAERPHRDIHVGHHDTPKTMTDCLVEHTQVVLDTLPNAATATQKEVATALKRRLDTQLGGMWHVIIGSSFGGNVTNDYATLVNFSVDGEWFLIFRSGPPEKPKTGDEDGALGNASNAVPTSA